MNAPDHLTVSDGSAFLLFGILALSTLVMTWLYVFQLGRLSIALLVRRRVLKAQAKKHELSGAVALFSGLWIYCLVSFGLGLLGIFTVPVMVALGALILLLSHREGVLGNPVAVLVATFSRWKKSEPVSFWGSLLGSCLFSIACVCTLSAWWDGDFVIAGVHMARTGLFIPKLCETQTGMALMTALTSILFPRMSGLNVITGWAPLFGPLLVLGMSLLMREIFPKRDLAHLALLILVMPLSFKAPEIRGSVAAFGLVSWILLFTFRYIRTADRVDLLAAVVTLGSAWNFSLIAFIYCIFFLLFLAAHSFFSGRKAETQAIFRLFLLTNLVEWPFIASALTVPLAGQSPWLFFLPGTITLGVCWLADRWLPRLQAPPRKDVSLRSIVPSLLLVMLLGAYALSPMGAPRYNYFFFSRKMDFFEMNFLSYGLLGLALLAALAVSYRDLIGATADGRGSRKSDRAAETLWIGFGTSCLFQFLCPTGLIQEWNRQGSWNYFWEFWKDSTLYWEGPFLVIGCAVLLERLIAYRAEWRRKSRSRKGGAGLSLAYPSERSILLGTLILLLLPLNRIEPYRSLRTLSGFLTSQLSPDSLPLWRSQQTYSLPLYVAPTFRWVSNDPWRVQYPGCAFCTVYSYGEWDVNKRPVTDFMMEAPLEAHDSFITSDSVLTTDPYFYRQVRYANGVNTVAPVYVAALNDATTYERYWKPGMKIRRVSYGMAYTVMHPERNLVWARSGEPFTVPLAGDYEIYRGSDFSPKKAAVGTEGRVFQPDSDSPATPIGRLEPGRSYSVTIMPPAGEAPSEAGEPFAVYPRRDWPLERYLVDSQGSHVGTFGMVSLMRFTGVPVAELTVEELSTVMTSSDMEARHRVFAGHHVRFILLDGIARDHFPKADALLSQDPLLVRRMVGETPVFTVKRASGGGGAG